METDGLFYFKSGAVAVSAAHQEAKDHLRSTLSG